MSTKSSNSLKRLCVLALLFAAPAFAADSPADEIIYRANLGRADDVKLLLEQGAPADQVNEEGVPLIALAANRRDAEGLNVLKVLVMAGADINGKDDNGQSALFYAARQGNSEAVKFLLEHGIDYYAMDDNGDIARNAAFKAGHNDILTQLDDFVKAQSAARMQQYDEFNKAVAENTKAATVPPPAPVEEKPAPPPVDAKQAMEKTRALAEQLSFNNCAFQYWYFCSTSRQPTELSAEELGVAMQTSKDAIAALGDRLTKELHQADSFVEGVSNDAKRHIYEELSAMGTNGARSEKGVGRMEDMRTRCGLVASQWDIKTIDTSGELLAPAPESPAASPSPAPAQDPLPNPPPLRGRGDSVVLPPSVTPALPTAPASPPPGITPSDDAQKQQLMQQQIMKMQGR